MKFRYMSILLLLLMTILFSAYAQDDVTPTPRPIFMTNTPQPRFVEQYRFSLPQDRNLQRMRWSPDGNYLIFTFTQNGSSSQTIIYSSQLWDATTGTFLRELSATPTWFDDEYYWVFDDDGNNRRRLRDLYFVHAQTGDVIYTLNDVQGQVRLNPERTQLSMGYRLGGRIYDTQTGEMLRQTGSQVSWSPDGAYTVNEVGDTIYVASAETGDVLYQLVGHQLSRLNTWSPDSARMIVEPLGEWGYTLNPIRVWTFPDTLSEIIYNTTVGQIWSPDSTRIATVMDALKLRIWDATTGDLLKTFNEHWLPSYYPEWSTDGHFIVLGVGDNRNFGQSYVVYDVEENRMVLNLLADITTNYTLDDNVLETVDSFTGIRRYDLTTGELIFEVNIGRVGFLRYSASWEWGVATNFGNDDDSLILIYDISQNRFFQTIETPFADVFDLLWHPTQNVFSVTGLINEVIVYRLEG